MANLKYRITMTPEVRTVSEIKGAPLTNIEVDSNFKLLDTAISDVRNELLSDVADVITGVGDASLIDAGAISSEKLVNTGVVAGTVGSATQIPVVTVNAKGQVTGHSTATPQTEWANVLSKPTNIVDLAALSSVDNLETVANLSSIAALTSINGVTTAADKMLYTTAANTYSATDLTPFARTILAADTAEEARTVLGANDASGLTTGKLANSLFDVFNPFQRVMVPLYPAGLGSGSTWPLVPTNIAGTSPTLYTWAISSPIAVAVMNFTVTFHLRVYGTTNVADTGGSLVAKLTYNDVDVQDAMVDVKVRNNDIIQVSLTGSVVTSTTLSRNLKIVLVAPGSPDLFVESPAEEISAGVYKNVPILQVEYSNVAP